MAASGKKVDQTAQEGSNVRAVRPSKPLVGLTRVSLSEKLESFDPETQRGEAMASNLVGTERLSSGRPPVPGFPGARAPIPARRPPDQADQHQPDRAEREQRHDTRPRRRRRQVLGRPRTA